MQTVFAQSGRRRSLRTVGLLGLLACLGLSPLPNEAQESRTDPTARVLAERYGLSAWDTVEQIDFVFRAELPDDRVIERSWSWRPKDGTVTADFDTAEARTFALDAIDNTNRADHAAFINDSYWLLFPFQLVWSTNTVSDDGDAVMPISGRPARKLTVTYPEQGGYTPGDVYELFLDPASGLIAEWNFRKGGGDQGRPATWETHVGLNGLFISRVHQGPEGSGFRLTFPRVAVHAYGSVAAGVPFE
ncbi:MAG: hypothetical protein AAGE65_08110 [Planctomycetota bacterium]